MKISPASIPETPRPESHAPKGIDNQNMSDGMPFLAVMNECQEESDLAVETQKPEAGTEAGGGARLDATVQKPDSAASSESGFEAAEDSGSSPLFPLLAGTAAKTISREPAKTADPASLKEEEDPIPSIPVLPPVAPQPPEDGKREMYLNVATPTSAEMQESSGVKMPSPRPPGTQSKAGNIEVQLIDALPEVSVGAQEIHEEITADGLLSAAEPSVTFPNRLNPAQSMPAAENTVHKTAMTTSMPSVATGRWRSADRLDPAPSAPGIENNPHEAAVNTALKSLTSSDWRFPVAGNRASTNRSGAPPVINPARIAEVSAAPFSASDQENPVQHVSNVKGSESGSAMPHGFAEGPSVLRNSFVIAADQNPSVRGPRTPSEREPSVITDSGVTKSQLSPAGLTAKFEGAAQSDPWAGSGDRSNQGELSGKALAGSAGDVVPPPAGKTVAARKAESEAPTRKDQSDPMPQTKETVAAPAESGSTRKTNVGIKDHGPSPLSASGGILGSETLSGSPGRQATPTASRTPELLLQLADRIQVQLRNGESEIRIQLKPELLGRLEIRAETGISGIVARIAAESGSVREYLANNLSILHQNLQDQGLKVDRVEVVLQDSFDARQAAPQQQPFNQAGHGGGGTPQHRAAGTTVPQAAVILDELIVDPLSRFALGPNSTFHTVA